MVDHLDDVLVSVSEIKRLIDEAQRVYSDEHAGMRSEYLGGVSVKLQTIKSLVMSMRSCSGSLHE